MEITFTPKAVHDGKLTGHVIIKVPTLDERLEYMELCGLESQSQDGSVSVESKGIAAVRKLLKPLKEKHLISVALSDGETLLEDYDALQYTDAGAEVLMEACGLLLSGFKPTKN